ncbi:MAG: DUF4394 domain-containing protein [Cyclobacteriaceae bacterium]
MLFLTIPKKENKITWFNAQNLRNPENTLSITGLPSGEKVISIDYRPATGQLYDLGISSRLYLINEQSGMATALGEGSFSPGIMGDNASIDFNPTVDRIRLVTNTGQNFRLHPDLGTVVAIDGDLKPGDPWVNGAAYANNIPNAATTELFVLDSKINKLFKQDPPNEGELEEIGDLGTSINSGNCFDIGSDSGMAYALVKADGSYGIYTVNLHTGKITRTADFKFDVVSMSVG